MEETLTVQRRGIHGALARTLCSTNPIERRIGAIAHQPRNVKRWRDGPMLQRWVGAAAHKATRGFRCVRDHRDLPKLCSAFERAHAARTVAVGRKVP